MEPYLVKVEWENGDITIERVISVSLDDSRYTLDEKVNGNLWVYKSMCKPYDPNADIINIKIGQLFSVEEKKYVIVRPATSVQWGEANDHGHIVITLFDYDTST